MELLPLGAMFLIMAALMAIKRPLYQAVLGGLIGIILFGRIAPAEILSNTLLVFTEWNSLSVLISLYLIIVLQRMLDAKDQIRLAQADLDNLFHSRKVNAVGAALFIGLLPSAAAMLLCGEIVKNATDGYLKPREQAFVAGWFRHIPESTLPTYASVLLMSGLSGVPLTKYIPGMIVPILVLAALGYFPYLHRLPKAEKHRIKAKDALSLVSHLWTLLLLLILILVFGMPVVPGILIVIVLAAFVYRFSPKECLHFLLSALDKKMLLSTFFILVLKEFIAATGALALLPQYLEKLPLPSYLVFAVLFFAGTLISGTSGIIAMGAPLAFSALPGGMPLSVLLMCMSHAANQVSPIHLCLLVTADHFQISFGQLAKTALPRVIIFCCLMIGYYNLLIFLGL